MGRRLWREDESIICSCSWESPAQSFWGPEFRGTHDHILLSPFWDSPNLDGQMPVFIYPRNGVAQLYLWALGSLFVASYNPQG
jgi:hypothetical protein